MIRRDFLKSTLGGALLCARSANGQGTAATPLGDNLF